jgi:HTH-type transcriptional repressor of NAD biosynthesis genes
MKTRGLLIGKFYPLHIGHISLIKFAEAMVDELIILVDNHQSYTLDVATRCSIIKNTFPQSNIKIIGIQEYTFQDPSESPIFWEYWTNLIKQYVPEPITCIIGAMNYVKTLAEHLECEFMILDEQRDGLSISATQIRNAPLKFWDFLAPESKPYFIKNIAIVGAESCWKSTLTKKLANFFNTNFAPEYARSFIETHGESLSSKDLLHIAKAQLTHSNILKTFSFKYLFNDTDAITTQCWHQTFFKTKNPEIELLIQKQSIDLYILLPVQLTWEKDIVRYHPEYKTRLDFYNLLKNELITRKINFVELKNLNYSNLFNSCKKSIKDLT